MPPTAINEALLFAVLLTTLSVVPAQPDPNPSPIPTQPQTQTFHRAPPATIPAFPEQSDASACPLDLSEPFFRAVRASCSVPKPKHHHHHQEDPLRRSRCCPVLAAWLYSAYSRTALSGNKHEATSSYDMPVLPDDSETCVDVLEKSLDGRNIELPRVNEMCDAVYCWCGIRLRKLSCSQAFGVDARGRLVGNEAVKRLERESGGGGGGGAGVCSKCLNSLYLLNGERSVRTNSSETTVRMRDHECELMGLTWLLSKNRGAYINTVSSVLRALMTSPQGSFDRPTFCSLGSDDMPLAVDSSEINDQPSSSAFSACHYLLTITSTFASIRFLLSRHY